jgi:hypothetical protein
MTITLRRGHIFWITAAVLALHVFILHFTGFALGGH